jgi:hypothetical protein
MLPPKHKLKYCTEQHKVKKEIDLLLTNHHPQNEITIRINRDGNRSRDPPKPVRRAGWKKFLGPP